MTTTPSGPVVCFCSIAFRGEPIEEIVPRLARLGYQGVEIWGNHIDGKSDAELDRLRRLAADSGLRIEALSPYFWLTRDLPDLVKQSLETAERFVRYARRLGAPRIRTFVDAGSDGIGSAAATEEHWQRAVGCLRKIAALAPELLFVVEMHESTLADTPESAARLLQRVGAGNLKLLLHAGGPDTLRDYRALRADIRHVHVHGAHSGGGTGYLEDGPSQLPAFLSVINRDGYPHTLSVEYCFQGATWARAESAREYLREHGLC
jgi:sugar phosphate isomerase/epimerase